MFSEIQIDVKEYPCDYCKKIFSRKYHLERHLGNEKSRCNTLEKLAKEKLKELEKNGTLKHSEEEAVGQLEQPDCEQNEIIEQAQSTELTNLPPESIDQSIGSNDQQTKSDQLTVQSAVKPIEQKGTIKCSEKITNNVVVNSQVNQVNQMNNQVKNDIIFVKHGSEKIDHITREIMLEILDKNNFSDMCVHLMKLMYFNVNVPQNLNWMIAYPKNTNAGVSFNHETNEFNRSDTRDIIDDKFANMINLLQPLIERICREDETDNILNTKQRRNVAKFFEHVGMLEISKESPDIHKKIHTLAYNYKTVPTTSWRNQGLNANHLSIKF